MRALLTLLAVVSVTILSMGQTLEHDYYFSEYHINKAGNCQTIVFDGMQQYGVVGEPTMPYQQVSLLLPPGEAVASVEYVFENETLIPGTFSLPPVQPDVPYSVGSNGYFEKNETVYSSNISYPAKYSSTIATQYLNGYSFALGKFTPLRWNPQTGALSYFSNVRIIIHTQSTALSQKALDNISSTENALLRVRTLSQNDEMMLRYPTRKPLEAYQLLIVTTSTLKPGFAPLKNYYDSIGVATKIVTVDSISSVMPGTGTRTKIRNYIIQQYQTNGIEYVILGGDVSQVDARGFYCYAVSGGGYEDTGIPADLYYSALDGTFDEDGDGTYGEALQDSVDLLPEISIGRFPVETTTELANMVNKSIAYQTTPIMADMNRVLMLGELLLDVPLTLGQDYLNLIIDNHSNNGYTTSGIPSATNTIDTLYDQWNQSMGYADEWPAIDMIDAINTGYSFIHHVGHSSETYMMRLFDTDVDGTTFSNLDGSTHSYGLVYTHGCMCGSFDWDDCIAEKAVLLDNFLVGGVFNSRYGWFNEGQTEGPSQHLHREFVNAIYNPLILERNLGDAFTMSKIATAPWVDLAGEYEFGAQRWVHYDNNLLGDPVLRMWVDAIEVGVTDSEKNSFSIYPNPSDGNFTIDHQLVGAQLTVFNAMGELVYSTIIESPDINLSALPAGLYLLQVNEDNNISSGKIIIR